MGWGGWGGWNSCAAGRSWRRRRSIVEEKGEGVQAVSGVTRGCEDTYDYELRFYDNLQLALRNKQHISGGSGNLYL